MGPTSLLRVVLSVTLVALSFSQPDETCDTNSAPPSLPHALSLNTPQSPLDPSIAALKRLYQVGLARAQNNANINHDWRSLLIHSDVSSEFSFSSSSSAFNLLSNATMFLNTLIETSLKAATTNPNPPPFQSINVIGAGPVGLINAVVASLHNSNSNSPRIIIYEKRSENFDRDIWFDVASSSVNTLSRNYDSLNFLRSLGLQYATHLNSTIHANVDGAGGTILTLPCFGLQRFLHKVLIILDVDIRFDSPPDTPRALLAAPNALTIISDGANSQTSQILSLEHSPTPPNTPPHKTVIAHLPSHPDGSCPALKKDARGKVIDPYFPGFNLFEPHGITSVFKRFFHNHCELQIFFSSDVDLTLTSNLDDAVHDVVYLLLEFSTPLDTKSVLTSDFSVLPKRLTNVGGQLGGLRYIVVGDAALSAHYRLGIGVNYNIFLANTFLPKLLSGAISPSQYSEQVSEIHVETQKIMLRYIKFESECNMVLFEDLVFARDNSKKDYFEIDWADANAGLYCQKRQTKKVAKKIPLDFHPQFIDAILSRQKTLTTRIVSSDVKGGEPQLETIAKILETNPSYETFATADNEIFADIVIAGVEEFTVGTLTDRHAQDEQFKDKEVFKAKLKEFYKPLPEDEKVFIFKFKVINK